MNGRDDSAAPAGSLPGREGRVFQPVAWLATISVSAMSALSVEAQMISPPDTVWGDIDHQPEGLVFGGVELLAGLLIALTVALGISAFLAHRQRVIAARAEPFELERLRRQLAWCTFGATPLLGLATILLAGPRSLFGVEVALLAVALSLVTLMIGTASLVATRA